MTFIKIVLPKKENYFFIPSSRNITNHQRHCRTERKEFVQWTFLAIGPADALALLVKSSKLKAEMLWQKQISSLRGGLLKRSFNNPTWQPVVN
jgi:hypothetical protein